MPVRTSAIFYRRGVPNSFNTFGTFASANYCIIQSLSPKIGSNFYPTTLRYGN